MTRWLLAIVIFLPTVLLNTVGDEARVENSTADLQELQTFRSSSSLVLVDVVALDPERGIPINGLTREDFQVFDNKVPLPIATFDTGNRGDARPLALWFVVICNEQPEPRTKSGLFAGNEPRFRSALDRLDLRDTVGVAHWCDNGDSALDLLPGSDRDAAIKGLSKALEPLPFVAPANTRVGELAAQRMFRAIIRDAHRRSAQPLPLIILLNSDFTGMPLKELNKVIDDFLETSGILFGIKDTSVPEMPSLMNGEQSQIFHYMAKETGGLYYSVFPSGYGVTLENIIDQMHSRYELGFKPPAIDGKKHKLRIELVGSAKNRYKKVRLRYRTEYIPVPQPPAWSN